MSYYYNDQKKFLSVYNFVHVIIEIHVEESLNVIDTGDYNFDSLDPTSMEFL